MVSNLVCSGWKAHVVWSWCHHVLTHNSEQTKDEFHLNTFHITVHPGPRYDIFTFVKWRTKGSIHIRRGSLPSILILQVRAVDDFFLSLFLLPPGVGSLPFCWPLKRVHWGLLCLDHSLQLQTSEVSRCPFSHDPARLMFVYSWTHLLGVHHPFKMFPSKSREQKSQPPVLCFALHCSTLYFRTWHCLKSHPTLTICCWFKQYCTVLTSDKIPS